MAGGVARDLGSSRRTFRSQPTPPVDNGAGFFFLVSEKSEKGHDPFSDGETMDFSKLAGLIPAVIQDADSAEVLMVGFMNDAALEITTRTGFATFFSRTRNTLWTKGETSGNRLQVVEMLVDCDDDTLLVKVKRLGDGNVCHTGNRSCFYRTVDRKNV